MAEMFSVLSTTTSTTNGGALHVSAGAHNNNNHHHQYPPTSSAPIELMDWNDFKTNGWQKWDQINFAFLNRKGTVASSLRKGIPYILRIGIPQPGMAVSQVSYSKGNEIKIEKDIISVSVLLRVTQEVSGENLTAEIAGTELSSVVQWEENIELEKSPTGISIGLAFTFLKNRKEICDLDNCAQNIPTKRNVRRIYSFIITLDYNSTQRQYTVDIPWKGLASENIASKRPKDQTPESGNEAAPPNKKFKQTTPNSTPIGSHIPTLSTGHTGISGIPAISVSPITPMTAMPALSSIPAISPIPIQPPEPRSVGPTVPAIAAVNGLAAAVLTPMITSVVPIMSDISLAEIQQQITSVFGQHLPPSLSLQFGSVPAGEHNVPHVFYVPKLSQIPPQYINREPEAKGPSMIERYYVPLEAKSGDNISICFRGTDQAVGTSIWFVYQGATDVLMANLLWGKEEVTDEDSKDLDLGLDFEIANSPMQDIAPADSLFSLNNTFGNGFQHNFILSEPLLLQIFHDKFATNTTKKTDVNLKTDFLGRTLLHHVAMKSFPKAVSVLLSVGFEPQQRDKLGMRPIDYALEHGVREVVDLLRNKTESLQSDNIVQPETAVSATQQSNLSTELEEMRAQFEELRASGPSIQKPYRSDHQKSDDLQSEFERSVLGYQIETEKTTKSTETSLEEILRFHEVRSLEEERAAEAAASTMRERMARKKELARTDDAPPHIVEGDKMATEEEEKAAEAAAAAMRDRIAARKKELAERKEEEARAAAVMRDRIAARKKEFAERKKFTEEEEALEAARAMKERIEARKREHAARAAGEKPSDPRSLPGDRRGLAKSGEETAQILRERIEARKKELREKKKSMNDQDISQELKERIAARKRELMAIQKEINAKKEASGIYSEEDSETAELAMRERHARRKSGLARKQKQKDAQEVEQIPSTEPVNDDGVESPEESTPSSPLISDRPGTGESDEALGASSPRRRGLSAEEEDAMKERIALRKLKLAGKIGQQDFDTGTSDQIMSEDMNKLVSELLEKAIDSKDSTIPPEDYEKENVMNVMEEAISLVENLSLDDDDDQTEEVLMQRHSERKKHLAEKEKLQEMERLKQTLEEEAAAEAAASALKERIVERKRHLAEKEKEWTSLPQKAIWSLQELQRKPVGLDLAKLESYLSDEEFFLVFGVNKITFSGYSAERQLELKREKQLV